MRAGVSLNPATPVSAIEHVIGDIDLILVMSVNPGFGGQKFIESQLDKIATLRKMIDGSGRDIDLEVDGGITRGNGAKAIAAGADVLVAGTATFVGGAGELRGEYRQTGRAVAEPAERASIRAMIARTETEGVDAGAGRRP